MKVYLVLMSLVCVIVAVLPGTLAAPATSHTIRHTSDTNGHVLSRQKRRHANVSELQGSITNLEQIERYYQHLLVRGYLTDVETARLEKLQLFIQHLRRLVPDHY